MVANSFNPAEAVGSLSLFLQQQVQHFGHGGFLSRTTNSSFLCFTVSLKMIIGEKIFVLDTEMRVQWGKNSVIVLACLAALEDELRKLVWDTVPFPSLHLSQCLTHSRLESVFWMSVNKWRNTKALESTYCVSQRLWNVKVSYIARFSYNLNKT